MGVFQGTCVGVFRVCGECFVVEAGWGAWRAGGAAGAQ